MAKRVQSPSSVNTFKQCKRKYYYNYIEKLPSLPNIHQVRGNIAHSTLEDFFDINISDFNDDNYPLKFQAVTQKLFVHQWNKYKEKLNGLNLTKDKLAFYFEETMLMLMNWTKQFIAELTQVKNEKNISLQEAFQILTPIREQEFRSEQHGVRGFIDAIKHVEEEVHIIDYKTNARFEFKDSIKLQLAIYCLLYEELHGKLPNKVGIFFLRHKLKMINVDPELLTLARRELELVHGHTALCEDIEDYPQTVTGLCKWRTGQCDFYNVCLPHGPI
tara:strand:- start:81031 stop:81852 length:822 start_codon:yes stop_codon:yes gene_type:complete